MLINYMEGLLNDKSKKAQYVLDACVLRYEGNMLPTTLFVNILNVYGATVGKTIIGYKLDSPFYGTAASGKSDCEKAKALLELGGAGLGLISIVSGPAGVIGGLSGTAAAVAGLACADISAFAA